MNNIVDELLLLSEVRKHEADTQPVDMGSVVSAATERLAHLIEDHEALVTVPDAWPIAEGYAPWLEEVWVNYLSNALKYGGDPPQIELGAIVHDRNIRFWVRDNGSGIAPKDQDRLFTPFTRLDQARAQGHGLGLSVVRRIMDKLDGTVGVESSGMPGEGSLFYFGLPQAAGFEDDILGGNGRGSLVAGPQETREEENWNSS
jgi:signal transduction histidine kinase